VVLAVEVVSPDSESRDRTTKPRHRPDRRRRPLSRVRRPLRAPGPPAPPAATRRASSPRPRER
jgi:hypothetical protein